MVVDEGRKERRKKLRKGQGRIAGESLGIAGPNTSPVFDEEEEEAERGYLQLQDKRVSSSVLRAE